MTALQTAAKIIVDSAIAEMAKTSGLTREQVLDGIIAQVPYFVSTFKTYLDWGMQAAQEIAAA